MNEKSNLITVAVCGVLYTASIYTLGYIDGKLSERMRWQEKLAGWCERSAALIKKIQDRRDGPEEA